MVTPSREDIDARAGEVTRGFIAQIRELMDRRHISRAELAWRMGVSRAFITRLLSGGSRNLTVRTMVSLSLSVNGGLEVKLLRTREGLKDGIRRAMREMTSGEDRDGHR